MWRGGRALASALLSPWPKRASGRRALALAAAALASSIRRNSFCVILPSRFVSISSKDSVPSRFTWRDGGGTSLCGTSRCATNEGRRLLSGRERGGDAPGIEHGSGRAAVRTAGARRRGVRARVGGAAAAAAAAPRRGSRARLGGGANRAVGRSAGRGRRLTSSWAKSVAFSASTAGRPVEGVAGTSEEAAARGRAHGSVRGAGGAERGGRLVRTG